MKTVWSRTRTLAIGTLLVLLTNAVALGGVWWNRSAEPDSVMLLEERELVMPYRGYRHRENSGLQLRLAWRVASHETADYYSSYAFSGGTPDWLDATSMRALGFEVPPDIGSETARRHYQRQLPREALLVLELAGASWQRVLERSRENAQRHEAAALANPGSKEFENRAKNARNVLLQEEKTHSRLFVVAVGRDADSLRARYPDRTRFMIVRATVRPSIVEREKQKQFSGYIGHSGVENINVPFALRPVLENLPSRSPAIAGDHADSRYVAELAVGRRLEPWIRQLRSKAQ